MEVDDITGIIIDTAFTIHTKLGPGLLESVYEAVLCKMLEQRGLHVERQKSVEFMFEGLYFSEGFRVDLLVDSKVVIELKSIEKLAPVHSKQLLTYLRLLNLNVGLVINFGGAKLKDNVERIVNKYTPSASS